MQIRWLGVKILSGLVVKIMLLPRDPARKQQSQAEDPRVLRHRRRCQLLLQPPVDLSGVE